MVTVELVSVGSCSSFGRFSITELVSCHQRFISLISKGAGSQVLGTIRRNVLYGGILHIFQLPIFKQCVFVKEMIWKTPFILLTYFGITFSCQNWTIFLLFDFLCFFISQIETRDKTQPEVRSTPW